MNYDVIIVGGGLAGSTLASQLARAGYKILVLEKETKFKDRVRGENMLPWGVAAAQRLGILDHLLNAGGIQPPYFTTYMGGHANEPRDLKATTPDGAGQLNMYHPDMQEVLLQSAIKAGAEVIRGTTVVGVVSGPDREPSVTFESNGKRETLSSQLVIGADGRSSQVRAWGKFDIQRNPDLLMIAGTLIQGTDAPNQTVHLLFGEGVASLLAPLGQKRARVYFVYPGVTGRRGLSGKDKVPQFLEFCQQAGAPASWFRNVESIGPLAEFNGADQWVNSPAKDGVVLVGDAAAASDPSWGSGLSLTLLDVENLANSLKSTSDWKAALANYAKNHDEYYGALHRILEWMTELFWSFGPEADARRGKVLQRMSEDPRGFPDSIGLGPFGPNDENARKLLLGIGY
jgi:2-polyprenyl-6-methoxyphenol hydroxylase-like FAD-dependent oxidoreductase